MKNVQKFLVLLIMLSIICSLFSCSTGDLCEYDDIETQLTDGDSEEDPTSSGGNN